MLYDDSAKLRESTLQKTKFSMLPLYSAALPVTNDLIHKSSIVH